MRLPNAGQQPSSKVDPSKLKIKRLTFGSPHVFGGSPKEGQDGGINRVSRHHQSATRGVPPEVNVEMVRLQGSLAVLGPDNIVELRKSVHEPLLHQLGNVLTSARSFASGLRSESRRLRKQWPKR